MGTLHLKGNGTLFEDSWVFVLAREDCWFERGVKKHLWIEPVDWDISYHPLKTQSYTPSVNNPNVQTFTEDLVTLQTEGKPTSGTSSMTQLMIFSWPPRSLAC